MEAHKHAFHGGKFFDAIGTDFCDLSRAGRVISADVLDAWFDPAPEVIARLREHLPFLARTSPPPYADGLIQTISRARGVPAANVCAGGGSSQLIYASLPLLTSGARRVLILDPMYGEYAHVLETMLQREVHRHHLRQESGFSIELDCLLRQAQQLRPELVVIVNPNSPTGSLWPRRELLAFLKQLPDAICIVDETYVDYVSADESLESVASAHPNLVIIKSMSKVYGLSGLRVAYLIASEEIVKKIAGRLAPWSVSLPAQLAAVEALKHPDYYRERYQETHALRSQALQSLCDLPLQLFDSCANFYLARTERVKASFVQQQLESEGVFVRNCDSMGTRFHDNYLRISVKKVEENRRIAAAFHRALAKSCSEAVSAQSA